MSIKIQCPDCGEPDTLPDSSLDKLACCNACGSKFAILHAVVDASDYKPPPKSVEQAEAYDDAMPRSEKLLLVIGLGIPALVFTSFLIYWFGMRDTWEIDNFHEVTALTESVLQAAENSNDDAALEAYEELVSLIGDRSIEDESLTSKVGSAEEAIAPINERIEKERLAREQRLAEERAREAQANAQFNAPRTQTVLVQFAGAARAYDWVTASEIQNAYDRAQTAAYSYRCPEPVVFAAVYIQFRQRGMSSYEAKETIYSMLEYEDTSRHFYSLPR